MPRFTKETAAILGKRGNAARWSPARSAEVETQFTGNTAIDQESRWVKRGLSREVMGQVRLLESSPCRLLSKLANSPDGEGRASLVARITDTAAKVYGWDAEKTNTLVVIGLSTSMDPDQTTPEQPVVEV